MEILKMVLFSYVTLVIMAIVVWFVYVSNKVRPEPNVQFIYDPQHVLPKVCRDSVTLNTAGKPNIIYQLASKYYIWYIQQSWWDYLLMHLSKTHNRRVHENAAVIGITMYYNLNQHLSSQNIFIYERAVSLKELLHKYLPHTELDYEYLEEMNALYHHLPTSSFKKLRPLIRDFIVKYHMQYYSHVKKEIDNFKHESY